MTINSINKNQEAFNTPLKYYYRDGTEATKYKVFSNPDKPKSKIRYSYEDCWKCDGKGVIDHYRYHDQGICYKCHDQKVLKTRVWTKEQTILARPKTIRAVGEQHWQNIGTWK